MSTTKAKTVAPSSIARTIAAANWPDVQQQTKLCKGIYWFSCAGHGGAVAVIGAADLPEESVEAARKTGMVELVAVSPYGRRLTSEKYTPASLRECSRQKDWKLFECWVGEEDCAWATIAISSPAMREGMSRNGGSRCTYEQAMQCVEAWSERFLMALDPQRKPIEGGQVQREQRRQRILDEGGVLLRCAWGDWAPEVPKFQVRALFSGSSSGSDVYYLMDEELYDRRGEFFDPRNVTPEEFAALGEIVKEQKQ